jgi:membrane protein implicated in regulation of membrane protease activity
MWLVAAILIAIFFFPLKWDAVLILCAAAVEISQSGFWFWWTHRARPAVGAEAMIGEQAEVVHGGWVRLQGELWRARGAEDASTGETVRVTGIDGLTLLVE